MGALRSCIKEDFMNEDIFSGKWKELKGHVKEKWGKLTEDDLTRVEGKREQFIGVLQQRYGYKKDQAEKELDAWLDSVEESRHAQHGKRR